MSCVTRWARACGFLFGCLLSGTVSQARAQLDIAASSCTELDPNELRGHVELEIGEVAAEWRELSSPVVLLGCSGDAVRIEIADPVTAKSVARTIAMPSLERERVLALAIAQLFLTSWLELLLDDDDAGPGAEAAERRALAALQAAIAPEPEAEPEPVLESEPVPALEPESVASESKTLDLKVELVFDGGPRLRARGEQLVTASLALRSLLVVDDSLLVGLRGGFEWGRAFRQRGTIHLFAGSLGIVAGWRTPELGPFSLDVVGIASLQTLVFDGHPSRPGVVGGTTVAIVGEGALELAPSLRAGPLRISLPLGLSGIGFAPEGKVTGEAPLVAGGLVFSAFLRISMAASLL